MTTAGRPRTLVHPIKRIIVRAGADTQAQIDALTAGSSETASDLLRRLVLEAWEGAAGAPEAPPEFMLAKPYKDEKPAGLLLSEKHDGWRVRWVASRRALVTRGGNVLTAPEWFVEGFPERGDLDGELWAGRGGLEDIDDAISEGDWSGLRYRVFDAPHAKGGFAVRLAQAEFMVGGAAHASVIPHRVCLGQSDLISELAEVVSGGGEGLVLRYPRAPYCDGRSWAMLKLKPVDDEEATVIGHSEGKGRCAGVVGSLIVEDDEGREFRLGAGLTDAVRRNPPAIGSRVTFSYQGRTSFGTPRCTRYLRVRAPGT